MKGKVFVYRDRKKQWRWRAIANNGRNVANCGESIKKRAHVVKEARIQAKAYGYTLIVNDGWRTDR